MAGMITERVKEEIRSRVDIVELIGSRMTLKKAGSTYKGCCPFHHEKTPSFNVNPSKQFYHCFGCGAHGDIFTFIQQMDGLTFPETLRKLAEKVGVTIEERTDYNAVKRNRLYALHAELADFYRRCLLQIPEAQVARDYLIRRKLDAEIAERFGIGYAPSHPKNAVLIWAEKHGYTVEEMVSAGVLSPPKYANRPNDFYDRFHGRIMFPVRDAQGRVVAFSGRVLDAKSHPAKYVNSPETEIFTKGKVLYALDKAAAKIVKSPHREAVICEGQIDVIRCHACGFENTVASEGTAFTKDHVALLKKHADSVILLFDGDAAGHKATLRTGGLFLSAEVPVRVATLPEGEDPDSFLRDKGPGPFQAVLDSAVSIAAFQVSVLREAERDPDAIDAVSRMTRAVLEMASLCPGAVMRSRLLQESADLLHVPLMALESDLSKVLEATRQRASYAERFKGKDTSLVPENPSLEENESGEEENPFIDGEGETANIARLDVTSQKPRLEPPPKIELQLCEFMAEFEHDEEVLSLLETYLPIDLVTHSFTRGFVSSVFRERKTGEDLLQDYCHQCEEEWKPYLGGLIANDQKMMSAKEFSKEEAARELIIGLWVQSFKKKQGALSASDDSGETVADRLRLSCLIKRLQTQPWETVRTLMTSATVVAEAPAPSSPAFSVSPEPPPVKEKENDPPFLTDTELPPEDDLPPDEMV